MNKTVSFHLEIPEYDLSDNVHSNSRIFSISACCSADALVSAVAVSRHSYQLHSTVSAIGSYSEVWPLLTDLRHFVSSLVPTLRFGGREPW